MKERPILFAGRPVRAILAGTKTQTRRIVKGRALEWLGPDMFTPEYVADPANGLCPCGAPGDRLWVRETHLIVGGKDSKNPRVVYRATNDGPDAWLSPVWTPSIHMPRWASRLLLEVTEVRVQRLQEISEEDARAEGITDGWPEGEFNSARPFREAFAHAWDSINGKRAPWASNPWVWAITFRRVS